MVYFFVDVSYFKGLNILTRRLHRTHIYICRYGCWGVCFTYGTWFALGALTAVGKTYDNSESIRKGVDFLLKIQCSDGGWGESYLSCPKKVNRVVQNIHITISEN